MIESHIEQGILIAWSMEGWLLATFYLPEAKRMVHHHSIDGDYNNDHLF